MEFFQTHNLLIIWSISFQTLIHICTAISVFILILKMAMLCYFGLCLFISFSLFCVKEYQLYHHFKKRFWSSIVLMYHSLYDQLVMFHIQVLSDVSVL